MGLEVEQDVQAKPIKMLRGGVVLVGPPGVGKGTQATLLSKALEIPHISTGAILRNGNQFGDGHCLNTRKCLEHGQLVPDEVVIDLVRQRLEQECCRSGFVLDGFPRTTRQAEELDSLLAIQDMDSLLCIFIQADHATIMKRLSIRAGIESRDDDTPGTVQLRLGVYERYASSLHAYYSKTQRLSEISGIGSTDEVHCRIMRTIDDYFSLGAAQTLSSRIQNSARAQV